MNPTTAMIVVNFDQIDAVISRRAMWPHSANAAMNSFKPREGEPMFVWHILRRGGEPWGSAMPSEQGDDGEPAYSDIKAAVAWIEQRIKEEQTPKTSPFTFYGGGVSSNQTVTGPFRTIANELERARREKKPPLASGWTKFGEDWTRFYTYNPDLKTFEWDDDDAK